MNSFCYECGCECNVCLPSSSIERYVCACWIFYSDIPFNVDLCVFIASTQPRESVKSNFTPSTWKCVVGSKIDFQANQIVPIGLLVFLIVPWKQRESLVNVLTIDVLISALFSICFCFFFVFSCVPFRFRLLGTPSVYQSTLELTPTSYKDHCKRLYYLVEKQRELCGLSQNVLSVRLYTNLFDLCINLFICGSPGLNSQIPGRGTIYLFSSVLLRSIIYQLIT